MRGAGRTSTLGGVAFEELDLGLSPGSVLVLYTDGLNETHTAGREDGMRRLADALARMDGSTPHDVCLRLLRGLSPRPEDDVAVLVVRSAPDRPAASAPRRAGARSAQFQATSSSWKSPPQGE